MIQRILGSVIVLISILVLPYWIYLPILFMAIILFPFFWEGVLFGFLIDTIYASGVETFSLLLSPSALSALIILIVLLPLRESLRSYV